MSELINLRTYVDTQIKTVIKQNDINNKKA